MGEGGGGEALSLFRFHLSPFPQKRLILRLSRTGTQNNNFLFRFLNFDTILQNSTPKKFANI